SFYPGAMSEARAIELGPLGGVDLVVVSPNDPAAMLRHTRECRDRGIPFVADPSQQLSALEPAQIRELIDGAAYQLTNEYEAALTERKTGWTGAQVLERVGVRVTTRGPQGALIEQAGEPALVVPVSREETRADPTGVGDAFRAGFLATRSWGASLERSAQVGNLLATYCLETVGTQEYEVETSAFLERLGSSYGGSVVEEVGGYLSG
ncbi:MAG TPA: PfkB family carbohydrate kinase, partial [Mycobacteriales bacterium]|nr:PfkB family carbohydrate kinase [Mycobacteriales bacterium]